MTSAPVHPTDRIVLEEWESAGQNLAQNLRALRGAEPNKALSAQQVGAGP
jgi:hypothetical protein